MLIESLFECYYDIDFRQQREQNQNHSLLHRRDEGNKIEKLVRIQAKEACLTLLKQAKELSGYD